MKYPAEKRLPLWAVHLIAAVITLVIGSILFYFLLPAVSVFSPGFWFFLLLLIAVYFISFSFLSGQSILPQRTVKEGRGGRRGRSYTLRFGKMSLIPAAILAVPLLVLIFGWIFSSTFFHAKAYASVITVEEQNFSEQMPPSDSVEHIALMDTETAQIVGNKTLGQLSDVVSQYVVSPSYTQINYQNTPRKVANLEYDGFFKWVNNRKSGIPGYVMVDPVGNSAEYRTFSVPMKYAESGLFGDDLKRALRFDYPTKIFGSAYFEVDEEGKPWYIVSCMKPQVGLFGASDVEEVILFDPVDGTSTLCPVGQVPTWVNIVYSGDLATEKYNWYGTLSGGFWNSVFGNRDCKETTDDYGYIAINDDVWYYTGVTSVASDESNIGFVLTNARTGAYKFFYVAGADEQAAMSSAQGKVQNMGYVASFPSLVNVDGQATYIMVLKDAAGLVKAYALVNVEHYELVATAATTTEVYSAYKNLLLQNGIITPEEQARTVTVQDIYVANFEGEPVIYFRGDDGMVYRGSLKENEGLILLSEGQLVTFTCHESETEGIFRIVSYEK